MIVTILSILVILLLAYNACFAYNVLVLVPRYGVRFFKLPGGKRVWMVTEITSKRNEESEEDLSGSDYDDIDW